MRDADISPDRGQDSLLKDASSLGRDPQRTPMQWNADPNAGFTTGTLWLPVSNDYTKVNVAAGRDDPNSMLMLYRRLIALRRAEPALAVGNYVPFNADGNVIAYIRHDGSSRFLIILNLGHKAEEFQLKIFRGHIILSTYLDKEGETVGGTLKLREDEGLIVKLG